jgi:hypothetical protein
MSMVVDLPPQLEKELAAEAANLGLSLPEYVVRVLSTGRLPGLSPCSGAELLTYWQREGLLGARADIADSQEHARDLRRRAQERKRA